MTLWLLFYIANDKPESSCLLGVFKSQVDAVKIGVPMLATKLDGKILIQRWTLGNVGPDPNEETVQ